MRPRALALPIVSAALLSLHAALFAGAMVDDAWISFRYARNLARGAGLVLDPGERVEGYTNFLWVVLAAPFAAIGAPVATAMATLGLGCAIATAMLAAWRAHCDDPGSRLAGLPTALIVTGAHGLAFHAVAGLETALYALLVLVASLAWIDRRGLVFGLATTLAFLTRPEAALLGLAGGPLLAHRARREGAIAIATMAGLVAPYLAFKLAYFGALLPNTLAAKPPELVRGLRYLAVELAPATGLVLAALAAKQHRALVIIALVALAIVAFEGGDWMPGGRMVVPWIAPLAIAADRPIRTWLAPGARGGALRVLAVVAVLAMIPWQIARSAELVLGVRERAPIDAARAALARRLEREGTRTIALLDIGLVGWVAPSLRIIDLGGLTNRTIAAAPGGHGEKRADLDYLESRAPDVVVLTSAHSARVDADGQTRIDARFVAEQHLETSDWLREHYVLTETIAPHPRYLMHVFRRR